jgi:hypothetical protein
VRLKFTYECSIVNARNARGDGTNARVSAICGKCSDLLCRHHDVSVNASHHCRYDGSDAGIARSRRSFVCVMPNNSNTGDVNGVGRPIINDDDDEANK